VIPASADSWREEDILFDALAPDADVTAPIPSAPGSGRPGRDAAHTCDARVNTRTAARAAEARRTDRARDVGRIKRAASMRRNITRELYSHDPTSIIARRGYPEKYPAANATPRGMSARRAVEINHHRVAALQEAARMSASAIGPATAANADTNMIATTAAAR
jgi:hypothetical protein